jgi:alpha-2-macroglobulin
VLDPGYSARLGCRAQFLYGAPAVGLHGEADISIGRDENPIAGEHGHADIKLAVEPPPRASTAPLKALISAGLFEPSGRAVKETIELPLKTQPFLIGHKPRFAENRTEADERAIVDVRVFDATGKGVGRQGLHWSLVREIRVYDWFEMNSTWRWHYHIIDEEIASGSLDVPPDTSRSN